MNLHFLFEGQTYNWVVLAQYLPIEVCNRMKDGAIDYIGYCIKGNNHTFLLPKVFVEQGLAFGSISIAHERTLEKREIEDNSVLDIIKMLPSWLGRGLSYYRVRKQKTNIIKQIDQSILRSSGELDEATLYECIYSLEDFYNRNKDLIIFTYYQSISGFDKINWKKTLRTKNPYISCVGDSQEVVYLDYLTRRKTIDRDEELMVLFFDTLRYIKSTYSFPIPFDCQYTLSEEEEFNVKVTSGLVLSELENIRNNYYSDKMIELWDLLFAFHKKEYELHSHNSKEDYMLVNKFEAVFEDMVDSLISDEKDDLFTSKHQEDDKRIDHLFLGKSLFEPEKYIYYIGDSKYYSDTNETSSTSIGKQFTYVTNIVQDAMSANKDKKEWSKVYFDSNTEGYNVTPNFFLRGYLGNNYESHKLEPFGMDEAEFYGERSHTIEKKLFDRNTLFLLQYKINFLYLLRNYNDDNNWERDKIKLDLESQVRNDLVDRLKKKYYFAKYKAKHKNWKWTIDFHFREVLGYIMCFNPAHDYPFVIIACRDDIKFNNLCSIFANAGFIKDEDGSVFN